MVQNTEVRTQKVGGIRLGTVLSDLALYLALQGRVQKWSPRKVGAGRFLPDAIFCKGAVERASLRQQIAQE